MNECRVSGESEFEVSTSVRCASRGSTDSGSHALKAEKEDDPCDSAVSDIGQDFWLYMNWVVVHPILRFMNYYFAESVG